MPDDTHLGYCPICGGGMDARFRHGPVGAPAACRAAWSDAYREWSKRQSELHGRPDYRRSDDAGWHHTNAHAHESDTINMNDWDDAADAIERGEHRHG